MYINCSLGQPLPKHIRQYQINNLEQTLKFIKRFTTPASPVAPDRLLRRDRNFSSEFDISFAALSEMPFGANDFQKPTKLPVLEFGLLLKDEFFLMCLEVDRFDVPRKANCRYTCAEGLNIYQYPGY